MCEQNRRVFILVMDGVGVGELPDAAAYGDTGSATLPNLAKAAGGLHLPNLEALGLGRIVPIDGVQPVEQPTARWPSSHRARTARAAIGN
jgi:phosphopentomutase